MRRGSNVTPALFVLSALAAAPTASAIPKCATTGSLSRSRYQVIELGHEQGGVEESRSGQLDTQSVAGLSSGAAPDRRTASRWAAIIASIYDVLASLPVPRCFDAHHRLRHRSNDSIPRRPHHDPPSGRVSTNARVAAITSASSCSSCSR